MAQTAGLNKMSLEFAEVSKNTLLITLSEDAFHNLTKMLEMSVKVDEPILGATHEQITEIHDRIKITAPDLDGIYSFELTTKDTLLIAKTLEGVSVVDTDDFFPDLNNIPDDNTMSTIADAFTNFITQRSPG